mmetsp:Transcript_8424/g.17124  ORF Transcript_8424/g.17124 Transcript_8424/m.17124 type:complete len:85 (-) Transcript_8424:163-417(-)
MRWQPIDTQNPSAKPAIIHSSLSSILVISSLCRLLLHSFPPIHSLALSSLSPSPSLPLSLSTSTSHMIPGGAWSPTGLDEVATY